MKDASALKPPPERKQAISWSPPRPGLTQPNQPRPGKPAASAVGRPFSGEHGYIPAANHRLLARTQAALNALRKGYASLVGDEWGL